MINGKMNIQIMITLTLLLMSGCANQLANQDDRIEIVPTETIFTVSPTQITSAQVTVTENFLLFSQPISFIRSENGSDELYVLGLDGSVTQITNGLGNIYGYHWSPDGREVLVELFDGEMNQNEEFSLWLMNSDGAGVVRIFGEYPILNLREIGWSPNGDRLFIQTSDNLLVASMEFNTIEPILESGYYSDVSWSPDGQQLLFAEYDPGNSPNYHTIYRINADGSGLTELSGRNNDDTHPTWSPDGSLIAFSRDSGDVHIMNSDGSEITQFFYAQSTFYWSPDSTKVAYFKLGYSITTFEADGSSPYPCIIEIEHPEEEICFPVESNIFSGWSNDGTYILVNKHFIGDATHISTGTYVINLVSREVHPLFEEEDVFQGKWVP